MFGPVSSQIRPELAFFGGERSQSLATNGSDDRLLDHGMARAFDDEVERAVDFGANIAALDRERRERRETSSTASASAAALIASLARDRRSRELFEGLELEVERAVGGAGDLGLELAQLGGGESDLSGKGLAMNEGGVERRAEKLLAVLAR